MDLADNTIKYFIEQVKSTDTAVPAGASTSALAGSSGIALLELIIEISIKNLPEKEKKVFLPVQKKLAEFEEEMLELISEDVTGYQLNQKSHFQNKEHLKLLIEIPLNIARIAAKALELEQKISPSTKPILESDLSVAKLNLQAALNGCLAIIRTNLENLELLTEEYKKDVAKEIIILKSL